MSTALFPTRERPQSILETLAAWRERTPERLALTVLGSGEEPQSRSSFRQLHERSLGMAQGLLRHARPGDRVLLLLPNDLQFVCGFFGCLAAGLVAVPAHHPPQMRKPAQWKRLQAIVDSCAAALIVVPQKSAEALRAMQSREGLFAGCAIEAAETLLAEGPAAATDLRLPRAGDLAFLQYTSGSTGLPKGVAITHGNIIANQEVIARLMGRNAHTAALTWLPLYHDMGLSALLQMGSVGSGMVLMAPADFVQQPLRWLQAISEHRIHTSGGPNFAYRLAAATLRTPEAAGAGLDLSHWEVAFCGAEPIQPGTVDDFLDAAAPFGLRRTAFFPCYGMAEATVMVTGVAPGGGWQCLAVDPAGLSQGRVQRSDAGRAGAKSLVACGAPTEGHTVRIVAADGRPVADPHEVGEIWVRGPSVGAGYFGDERATEETFRNPLPGDDGGPYLRTGDLGVCLDGQLYVTGRVKDMLIIRGRNLYPQDLEDCVQDAVPELRRGCGAAFPVQVDGEEKLVLVQEIGRTRRRDMDVADVFRRMVVAISEDFGLTPHQVVLVETATIEKTSSGKIARALCRRAYLQGELRSVATWTEGEAVACAAAAGPATSQAVPGAAGLLCREVEDRIVQVAAGLLKMDAARVPRTTPWAELGVDSIHALQLAQKVQQATGVSLDAAVLWECAHVRDLAAYIAARKGADAGLPPRPGAAASPRADAVPGCVPDAQALAAMSDAEAEALLLKELAR